MMPTNVAARMTLAADPGSLHGAVAAGILGCGPVVLGTAEECARMLADARERRRCRRRAGDRGRRASHATSTTGREAPGLRPSACTGRSTPARSGSSSSPTRAASSGEHVLLARCLRDAVAEVWGKPLTMNVSLPIAAVMLDLGLPGRVGEVGPDPRADGGPPRAPCRGARAAARVPHGGAGGGGDRPTSAPRAPRRS